MSFLDFDGLRDALADAEFDQPPAFVANAHVTGLGVARALSQHGVPVVAIDRTGTGAASGSDAVDYAGQVTYPLDDLAGFTADVETLAAELDHAPVAFGCMDEWALAFAEADPEGVRLPFADFDIVDSVLDKSSLYEVADDLGVPYPDTIPIDADTDPDDLAAELDLPLVIKPAYKRELEEAAGTNVIEVEDRDQLADAIATARDHDIQIMAQEKVDVAVGEDCSLASYVPESGTDDALAVVGNPKVRHPFGFGTSCVVETVDRPDIEDRALAVLDETGYHGISEAEFVYDAEREDYVLLDVNTRPWKWIGLPVAAGRNLPYAAYADAVDADAVDADYQSEETDTEQWVYLPDYLDSLATNQTHDVLAKSDWLALMSGDENARTVAGVYRPDDPEPAYDVLQAKLGTREYYCAC
ncbi:carboxylate--amine ligase [Halocalculus aciditolerans]|uniref:ATP-grasp domain-containing protein n=1 Tax=Halocalculus aciditolerans TaxID=1383812 RepID=A0A830FFF7_9EURY|nr:carboxylate--amine ligase [Halocalculus aciditolerans]GGL69354.1 hypothetical protein GCM10009039_29140 [Halocalculus aciditolerans]